MASVYLETSFVSACVTGFTTPADLYQKGVSLEWWNTQASRHELFVSAEVYAELSHPSFSWGSQSESFLKGIPLLAVTEEAQGFAEILVREQVMPGPVKGDSLHVALATIYGMDFILSWNVRHLANPNKVKHLQIICRRLGLIPPQIITPEFLWESD